MLMVFTWVWAWGKSSSRSLEKTTKWGALIIWKVRGILKGSSQRSDCNKSVLNGGQKPQGQKLGVRERREQKHGGNRMLVWTVLQWVCRLQWKVTAADCSQSLSTELLKRRTVVECVWNVMAHAQKPDFVFRRNGQVHLNRRGASVQLTAGSRGVRISGSNAGYTTFRGSVKSAGYPLHSPVSPSLPLPSVTVCHQVSNAL